MLSRGRRLLQDRNIPPKTAAAVVFGGLALALLAGVAVVRPGASAGEPATLGTTTRNGPAAHAPPVAAMSPPARRRFPARGAARPGEAGSRPGADGSGGWWFGTAGVALALALVGWGSVAARGYAAPGGGAGPVAMRVVGRTSLSARHTVYLLDVGGRVLIVGAGPQGAPTLLGELTDAPSSSSSSPAPALAPHFDHRLGDES